MIIFDTPTSKTKVRKGVYAYRYSNGLIEIEGQRFYQYSIKDAIKLWRNKNPL